GGWEKLAGKKVPFDDLLFNIGNYRDKFLGTLDKALRDVIEGDIDIWGHSNWHIHHSYQVGRHQKDGILEEILARRLWEELPPNQRINVHDPAHLFAVPTYIHDQIHRETEAWWAAQMKKHGWKNYEQAFREVNLKEYKEFAEHLREKYKPY